MITHISVNNKTKDRVTKEHMLYLTKHKIDLTNNMQICM